jgi:predicted AlkP superfamily phosphohydrolase/phosphomutase
MWKFMSPDHPLHEPRRAEKYGSAIFEYYQHVDQELGRIVASLDPDTVLILMSDHGFGPFHKFIHVNNWLRQHGWLRLKQELKPRLKSAIFDMGFTPMGVYNLLMSFGLGYLKREVVRGRGQGLLKTLFLSFDDVDWSQTTAYSLGNVGQINLNVRGREPQGIVNPGPDYEKIRQDIIDRLQELRDPETGEHVIQEIYRREEIYWGDRLEQAADILFVPTRMEYFGFGEYEFGSNQILERMKRGISGTHRMNGTLVMHGTPVKPGVEVEDACLYDLAPTILHLMGEPIPSDMDGQVLTEALTAEYADPSQVRYVDSDKTVKERSVTQELSAEDESTLTERLRSLGYVA